MTPWQEQMKSYAEFHQNPKNQWTHFFGIPIVLFSFFLLFTAVRFPLGDRALSLAWVALMGLSIYYLVLDFALGFAITLFSVLCVVVGQNLYLYDIRLFWIITTLSMIAGWGLQFLGHYYEGRRPAFFKNALHLLNGPLFVAAKLLRRS